MVLVYIVYLLSQLYRQILFVFWEYILNKSDLLELFLT